MATLSSVFSRISGGAPSVASGDAQKALMKAGGFGMLSLTGGMLKKGIAKAIEKGDANGDGKVDVDEFTTGVRAAALGKGLPKWEQLDPAGSGSKARDALAELVKAAAKQKGGALGAMVDADGIAQLAIALLDDDGDGAVSKKEYDQLLADVAA